ncbi:hypothetical protein ACHQM5_006464 [Ranunculus cassubicifolius]
MSDVAVSEVLRDLVVENRMYILYRTLAVVPSNSVGFNTSLNGGSIGTETTPKWPRIQTQSYRSLSFGILEDDKISSKPISEETEGFLLNAINMTFLERLDLAWKVLFPPPATIRSSNARIAKQRLKMILFSDRCAVSDEAKQKIVSNIVGALSDFVEIESQDKVQLSVSTDPDLGTVYSVTVPVRRVKSNYQEDEEYGMITNVDYKDKGEQSGGSVDVKFDFYLPNE